MSSVVKPRNLPLLAQILDYTCGAACFASLHNHLTGAALTEFFFAEHLQVFGLGYTSPEEFVGLAKKLGFRASLRRSATLEDLFKAVANTDSVVAVIWWDVDAGHYSLIEHLNAESITLMDPWLARSGEFNTLPTKEFEGHWQARGAVLIEAAGIAKPAQSSDPPADHTG